MLRNVKTTIKAMAAMGCMAAIAFACSHDAYESGDSKYSYLRTDFVTAYANTAGLIPAALTDNDDSLVFSTPIKLNGTARTDSTYRLMLYYDLKGTDLTRRPWTVTPMAYRAVPVLQPLQPTDSAATMTDPVVFESAWASSNGRYLNLSLSLMTGQPDTQNAEGQSLGIVLDGVRTEGSGRRIFTYHLCHSQGNIPEYYKSTVYVSLSTRGKHAGDIVRISLNTYQGWITREFIVSR